MEDVERAVPLLGHVARHPGPTREILRWRSLQWWREEQQLPDRVRAKHPHQFNTQLTMRGRLSRWQGTIGRKLPDIERGGRG